MPNYDPSARLLMALPANLGASQTLAATGNSGTALIDLRNVLDVALFVDIVGSPAGSAPTLLVGLDVVDAFGVWTSKVITTASLNAAGQTAVYGGLHGATPVVFPAQGRLSWTVGGTGGPSFAVQISLYGR